MVPPLHGLWAGSKRDGWQLFTTTPMTTTLAAPVPSPERTSKRERTQLTIQASPDLLTRVRQMAEQRRQTVTAVVVEALESYIAGDQVFSVGDDELAQRVADLERRVQQLEAAP